MRITWRVRRRIRLWREGFLRFETKRFAGGEQPKKSLVDFPISRPYMKAMRRDRRSLYRAAFKAGWTMSQYEEAVKEEYKRMGWLKPDKFGRQVADPWAMFRYYYKKAEIEGDTGSPPPKTKPHRPKGDVQAQKARYRERRKMRVVRDDAGRSVGHVVLSPDGIWSVQYD